MAKKVVKGLCGICPGNCGVEITLENDRIASIHPWREHIEGVPCIRGCKSPEIVYSKDRITNPLKRKGPKGTLEFEAISWEQAFDEIAKKIFVLKGDYGPECIASFFGRGNFEQSLWQMFTPKRKGYAVGNSIFMPLGSPNAFSVGSICFHAYGILAPFATYGSGIFQLQPDLENAEIIVVWGSNPATDSPLRRMIQLQAAKKRGAKIIAIDPLRTQVAKLSDQWIPIQPGTDGVLIHGMLNICFQNGKIDREFGEQYCQGFFDLEAYVQQFSPDRVAEITRVPEDTVRELTEIFTSTQRIACISYTGLEYSNTGVQCIRAFLTLLALTGHLDVKGGQRFCLPPRIRLRRPEVTFPIDVPPIGMDRYPYHCSAIQTGQFMEFPRSVLYDDPYKIRFLLIGGASILTSFPNTNLYRKALGALDYLVTVDRFLNADACYADLVLPATTYYEITSYCGYPALVPPFALQYREKVIEPLGEAMNDYLIYAKLAERLGYGHLYPQTEEEMVRFVTQDLPVDFRQFKRRSKDGPVSLLDPLRAPTYALDGEEKKWKSGALRHDNKPGFATKSGKWEISSSLLSGYGYNPLPAYEGVAEGPEANPLNTRFPLTLTTGTRIQSTFRSQHLNIPGLVTFQPSAEVIMHSEDARARDIRTGDDVMVTTVRGSVKFRARVTDDILQGVVEVNQGGGSPIQVEGWKESNVNLITDDKNRDSISGFPVFKALLCDIKKAPGIG
ncbi:MAG: molybdopterin-dependent oxidoreductase [Deltaproteobacteria bacterium]|nr:molybdopterin-dependent oxidoreductase [Deltaproteobacteria bacterium]